MCFCESRTMKIHKNLLCAAAIGIFAGLTAGATLADVPAAKVNTNSRASASNDWPQWRGPNRDNVSTETGLLKQWPKGGPPLAWEAKDLGAGFSSVSVANGHIY